MMDEQHIVVYSKQQSFNLDTSPMLERLIYLDDVARHIVEEMPIEVVAKLRDYYNFILISSRAVVRNVDADT